MSAEHSVRVRSVDVDGGLTLTIGLHRPEPDEPGTVVLRLGTGTSLWAQSPADSLIHLPENVIPALRQALSELENES